MIYYKPKNLTYSQLCQWIDNNACKDDCDDYTLYRYLYLIIDLLAKKNHYFKKSEDYEDFSIFTANKVFLRIINSQSDNGKNINYILPYLKKILRFSLFDYINENKNVKEDLPENVVEYSFRNLLNSLSSKLCISDFKLYIDEISSTIELFFSRVPKKKGSDEWINIKTSVLLTFWNRLNFNKEEQKRIEHLKRNNNLTDEKLARAFQNRRNTGDCILISLDESYKDYINALCNELTVTVGKDLQEILGYSVGVNMDEVIELFSE